MKYILLFHIKLYQNLISPYIDSRCKHKPTCSNYAIQAIREHGAIRGSTLTLKRIWGCK
jgi:hypothetical protein